MICFVVTYTNAEGANFNFDYYLNTHLPMADDLLSEYGLLKTEVGKGIKNSRGELPAYTCITQLHFSNIDQMTMGFSSHGAQLKADIKNYTNIDPVFTLIEKIS